MKAGRPSKMNASQLKWAKREWQKGTVTETIAWACHVSKSTLYRYAARHEFGLHPLGNHIAVGMRGMEDRPVPTLYRCACGGRATEAAGHAACRAVA